MSAGDPKPIRAPRGQGGVLNQLVAGQAANQQRLEELFRRIDGAEKTAGEARDTAKEIATILREQNMGERMGEMRTEMMGQVSALRQDVVAANGLLRQEHQALSDRLGALETKATKAVGVADFFAWLSKVAPWLFAGLAAFVAGIAAKGHGG